MDSTCFCRERTDFEVKLTYLQKENVYVNKTELLRKKVLFCEVSSTVVYDIFVVTEGGTTTKTLCEKYFSLFPLLFLLRIIVRFNVSFTEWNTSLISLLHAVHLMYISRRYPVCSLHPTQNVEVVLRFHAGNQSNEALVAKSTK